MLPPPARPTLAPPGATPRQRPRSGHGLADHRRPRGHPLLRHRGAGGLAPTAVQPGELPVIVWAATTLTTLLLLPILAASAALDALARRLARPLGRHLAVALATTAALLWANADAWSARVWYFRLTPLVFTAALWLAFAWRRSERHQPVLALTVAVALLGGTVANRLVYPDQYTGQHLALVLLSWFCLRLFVDTPARRRAERAANLALAVAAAAFFVAGRGTLTAPQT